MVEKTFNEFPNGDSYRVTTMVHLNGNMLAAVDIKTTGLDSSKHEIYEIGIIPLDSFINRRTDKLPLDLMIRPNYPNKIDWKFLEKNHHSGAIKKALDEGFPHVVAMDLFDRWFDDLQLPVKKRVAPVGHNYGHESRFLREWMGHMNYDLRFDDSNLRDVRSIARFINDLADIRGADYPLKKVNLSYLCNVLHVNTDYGRTNGALHEAAMTGDVYRAMLKLMHREMIA